MDMTGEYRIPAARETVWRALNDPEILKQCIPGCETVEKVSDTEFTARVAVAVGPVKAKFNGRVTLTDLQPPESYTISGEGQGGVAGFGKGSANVRLEAEAPIMTVLRYTAQATVGGKLAQIGARLVDATARKLADEFFSRFASVVAAPAEPGAAAPEPVATPAETVSTETPTAAAAPARPALAPVVWIPLLIAVIGILLWLVTR
ncbi:MAG TPA: carbon monoxide dehydrogenase subunit G [Alphaproteobacteria bacterium]|nr:carbon monoxide dehydrogenase subunit G [Alphaproteobacteria bacterium]